MSKVKYFSGKTELNSAQPMRNSDFDKQFPYASGRRYDSFSMWVGRDAGGLMPVDRIITYKSNPSMHECDSRCANATGRVMKCECSCGGKNHGQGAK